MLRRSGLRDGVATEGYADYAAFANEYDRSSRGSSRRGRRLREALQDSSDEEDADPESPGLLPTFCRLICCLDCCIQDPLGLMHDPLDRYGIHSSRDRRRARSPQDLCEACLRNCFCWFFYGFVMLIVILLLTNS